VYVLCVCVCVFACVCECDGVCLLVCVLMIVWVNKFWRLVQSILNDIVLQIPVHIHDACFFKKNCLCYCIFFAKKLLQSIFQKYPNLVSVISFFKRKIASGTFSILRDVFYVSFVKYTVFNTFLIHIAAMI